MAKVTKSWGVTILFTMLVAILPVINEPLEAQFGITITEDELAHFLTAFGITAAAGVGNAARKQLRKPVVNIETNTAQNPTQTFTATVNPPRKHDPFGIQFGPPGAWYQTNFQKNTERGNVLQYGQSYLWIKVDSARSYITAILKDNTGRVIQIDQSSETDEDNNRTTTRLEMFTRNGTPLPRGKYSLQIQSDSGSGDSQGIKEDVFYIV